MTKLERERYKKIVAQAKSKEEGDVGKNRYRVRGPPWAMFIAELPPAPMIIEETGAIK